MWGSRRLINALMNRKAYARTSSQPGKTQTINFYNINDALYYVDLPGYGYAKVAQEVKAKWGKMIENYLHQSPMLKRVFLLIDIRHEPSVNDKHHVRLDRVQRISAGYHCDEAGQDQPEPGTEAYEDGSSGTGNRPGCDGYPIFRETKQGRDEIWALIEEMMGGVLTRRQNLFIMNLFMR